MYTMTTSLEALAQNPPELTLTDEDQNQIACLALMLDQAEAARLGLHVATHRMVPYLQRSEASRAAMRMSVVRVIQAMKLLGWLGEDEDRPRIHLPG